MRANSVLPERLGLGQTVRGAAVVSRLSFLELYGLANLTRWAAEGCLHANQSVLGAQLMRDAAWLEGKVAERTDLMAAALPPEGCHHG